MIYGFKKFINASFTYRSVKFTGLTKTAASDATPHDLKNDTVLYTSDIRNNRLLGIISIIKVFDHFFANSCRNSGNPRGKGFKSSILVILNIVKSRNIESGN